MAKVSEKEKKEKTEETKSSEKSEKKSNGKNQMESTIDGASISENIDVDLQSLVMGVPADKMEEALSMTELEKETTVGYKSDLTDTKTITKENKVRIDDLDFGETKEVLDGVKVTVNVDDNGDVTNHIESDYLGTFDYDPKEFALGYKEIEEADGSTSKLPVLSYIGGKTSYEYWEFDNFGSGETHVANLGSDIASLFGKNQTIKIPEGLKVADYMFEGNKDLKSAPKLPESLTSMHCMFEGCKNMELPAPDARTKINIIDASEYAIPEGVEDMSGAFKNCDEFKHNINEEHLKNVKDMREFHKLEDEDAKGDAAGKSLWGLAKEHVTKVNGDDNPYLSSETTADAYAGQASEDIKEAADTAEYAINADGTINKEYEDSVKKGIEEGNVDEDALQDAQITTGLRYDEKIIKGDVQSEVELASGGSRSTNKVYNGDTDECSWDETGEIRSDDVDAKSSTWWQHAVIDGVTGLGIYGVTRIATGNKVLGLIAGVGGTLLLDKTNILPDSFAPILKFTSGMLPEGSLKDKVDEWYEKFSVSDVEDQQQYFTSDRVAEEHAALRAKTSVSSLKSAYYMSAEGLQTSLSKNAEEAAKQGAFWAIAREGESGDSVKGISEMIEASNEVAEASWADRSGDKAALTEEMKSYYKKVFDGLQAYDDAAVSGIDATYGADKSTRNQLAKEGLGMTNRAATEKVLESMRSMEETYGVTLLSEKELSEYKLTGCDSLAMYDGYTAERSAAKSEVDALMAVDGLDYESADYEYDGEEYESRVRSNEKTKAINSEVRKQQTTEQSVESRTTNQTAKNTTKSRGELAEEKLGVTGNETTVSNDMEYE